MNFTLSVNGIENMKRSFRSTSIKGTKMLSLIFDVWLSTRFSSSVYPDDEDDDGDARGFGTGLSISILAKFEAEMKSIINKIRFCCQQFLSCN